MVYFILLSLVVLAIGIYFVNRETQSAVYQVLDKVASGDLPERNWPVTMQQGAESIKSTKASV